MNTPLKTIGIFGLLFWGALSAHAGPTPDAVTVPKEIQETVDREGSVRVIIEFSASGLSPRMAHSQAISERKVEIKSIQDRIMGRLSGNAGALRAHSEPRNRIRAMEISPLLAITVNSKELTSLSQDPEVVAVHLDHRGSASLQNSVPLIGMTGTSGAYSLGATGDGQTVAILDTGVQSSHPFLSGKVIAEACFSGGGNPSESLCPNGQLVQKGQGSADVLAAPRCQSLGQVFCWHGTHVAGIAAGLNPLPTVPPNGVAKSSKIIAVQVFSGLLGCVNLTCLYYYDSDIIAALEWLYQSVVNTGNASSLVAINMSFGGGVNREPCDTDPMKPLIDHLKSLGIATVASSGNASFKDALSSPACISSVIAVGSSKLNDTLSTFSNQSPMVSLIAPGDPILSSEPINLYASHSGTSMAAPHVSGAIAAIKTRYPNASVDRIVGSLRTTGVPIVGIQTKPRIVVNDALNSITQSWSSITVRAIGSGLISSQPDGLYCNSQCSADFLSSGTLTLTAAPASGYRFTGWSGDCSGKETTCQVGLGSNRSVQANFVKTYPVGVRLLGSGVVKSQPVGIDCGSTCAGTFDVGTPLDLTATASPGYVFKSWTGNCSGSSTLCRIDGTTAAYVTAEFGKVQTLTVTRNGSGVVSSTPSGIQCGTMCSGSFGQGSVVDLNATADLGWRFGGWAGACNGLDACRVTLSVDQSVTANFNQLPLFPLEVNRSNTGLVSSEPQGISCGGKEKACIGQFSDITLTATAHPGYGFKRWIGCGSRGPTCQTTLTIATRISAVFERLQRYPLVVQKSRGGRIQSDPKGLECPSRATTCRGQFQEGTKVLLSASPDNGKTFAGWGGACSGSLQTCEVNVDQAKMVSANFQ